MEKVLFSEGILLFCDVVGDFKELQTNFVNSIQEFRNHNIIETAIDDVA